jgi:phosphoheptose isomerase
MQCKENKDDIFLFKEFILFFIRLVRSGISQSNHCLLILNGHGSSHVILKTIKNAHQIGLDMITLPSHTSKLPQIVSYSIMDSTHC